jgi:hypothetical protein
VEEQIAAFDISPQEKSQKSLDLDFLVANLSVPCSGLLSGVWNELDYRIDICRVTKGSHT